MTNKHGFEVTPEYLEGLLYNAFFDGYQSAPDKVERYAFTPGTKDSPNAKGFRVVSDEMRAFAKWSAKDRVAWVQNIVPEPEPEAECSWCGEEDCSRDH
jgi:hypothetical protein